MRSSWWNQNWQGKQMYLQKAHPSTSVTPVSGFQSVVGTPVGITGQRNAFEETLDGRGRNRPKSAQLLYEDEDDYYDTECVGVEVKLLSHV
jgi:hypothetical protein